MSEDINLNYINTKMIKFILQLIIFKIAIGIEELSSDTEKWPDGSSISSWFSDTSRFDISNLKRYVITEYNVKSSSDEIQTEQIQYVIDLCSKNGGGLIVIPKGTFYSGSLFFKQKTHLLIEEGGELKGSDRIRDFKIVKTRIEGQTLNYFSALINADNVDNFSITGPGIINGNGQEYWEEFWIRRKYNKDCTNLEAMRPRNIYISNSKNVTIQDVKIINSPFWTTHIYRCENVRYLGCYIYAPTQNVTKFFPEKGAPSSDAIDIDNCTNVLINGCYMNVNDDGVVLKGGKGTWADLDENNGECKNIIVENCSFGEVGSLLTLGSESIYDKNIIVRNNTSNGALCVLRLKFRPDTPQHFEYINVENITGKSDSFLMIRPWTQFYVPEIREDMPLSQGNNIIIRNINMETNNFFNVKLSEKYKLSDFTFEHIKVKDEKKAFDPNMIENTIVLDVDIY